MDKYHILKNKVEKFVLQLKFLWGSKTYHYNVLIFFFRIQAKLQSGDLIQIQTLWCVWLQECSICHETMELGVVINLDPCQHRSEYPPPPPPPPKWLLT